MKRHLLKGLMFTVAVAIVASAFSLSPASIAVAQAHDNELVIPLVWGRSTEDPASIPFSSSVGAAVNDGLALPLDPNQAVFDNGVHTPPANIAAIPSGNEWASWPLWHGDCFETYEVRHLQATFTLPTGLGDILDIILFSPFYTDQGNIIPINDNVYVYLNGTFVGQKGTSYGAANAGMAGSAPFANETDGWYQDGSFGSTAADALEPGPNVLDIVSEELCGWGGIGRVEIKLVLEPILLVDIDVKPGSDPNCFNNNGHGVIPVAILTADTFDASTVDPFSVTMDGAGVRVKGKSGKAGSLKDIDNDGDLDLVVQIEDVDGTYHEDDTIATLTGETFDGTHIRGTDSICIVP